MSPTSCILRRCILMKANELLLYLAIKYKGDWMEIYEAIKRKEKIDNDKLREVVDENKDEYITLIDDDYPSFLKDIIRPPFVLFYKGERSLLNKKREYYLSVVGTRKAGEYGKNMTREVLLPLPKEVIIVSGLAKGIDGFAHKAALDSDKKTIAILGGGINNIYPNENEWLFEDIVAKGGLLISEYPGYQEPEKANFLARNRLVAAFGKALLVVESYEKSGTYSTLCSALNEGRDIGCIPYRANENSNCNKFIKEGACLIENHHDILNMLGIKDEAE